MHLSAEGDYRLQDEAATARLGAAVGLALEAGEAVCLWGPLGAGKTTLARGLIRALADPNEDAPSPTFTLVQFYPTERLRLAHFDLYRIERPDEAHEIGLDEALDDGAALIEWPERLGELLPKHLSVTLEVDGDGRRALLDV